MENKNNALRIVDKKVFSETVERFHRELQLHSFKGRSSLRASLYRIATNACLDFLRGRARRIQQLAPKKNHEFSGNPLADVPCLQPYPDHLLKASSQAEEPGAIFVEKETIELVFIIALQHLPPRQQLG